MSSSQLSAVIELVVDGLGSFQITPAKQVAGVTKFQTSQIELANGANTITIPAAMKYVLIVFDTTSSTVKTLKGIAGDTGIVVAPGTTTSWVLLPITTGSFVINSAGADTGKLTTITFF